MGKLERTWELAKVSWEVLIADTELLWLPVLSALSAIAVSAMFFLPLLVEHALPRVLTGPMYLGLLLFYFCNSFVMIFFNTALISAATERLQGRTPTLAGALAFAFDNIGRIAQWAAVAATVGMLLRMIEERVGWIGKLIIGLLGAAWGLATYFVVPVLVFEQLGPIDAVMQSAAMFKKTWGERLIGSVSFGLLFFLLSLPLIAAPFLALLLFGGWAFVIVGAFAFVGGILLAVVHMALQGIFTAALYQYARTGQSAGPFTAEMLGSAWRPK